jgi:hypothetical protein
MSDLFMAKNAGVTERNEGDARVLYGQREREGETEGGGGGWRPCH